MMLWRGKIKGPREFVYAVANLLFYGLRRKWCIQPWNNISVCLPAYPFPSAFQLSSCDTLKLTLRNCNFQAKVRTLQIESFNVRIIPDPICAHCNPNATDEIRWWCPDVKKKGQCNERGYKVQIKGYFCKALTGLLMLLYICTHLSSLHCV